MTKGPFPRTENMERAGWGREKDGAWVARTRVRTCLCCVSDSHFAKCKREVLPTAFWIPYHVAQFSRSPPASFLFVLLGHPGCLRRNTLPPLGFSTCSSLILEFSPPSPLLIGSLSSASTQTPISLLSLLAAIVPSYPYHLLVHNPPRGFSSEICNWPCPWRAGRGGRERPAPPGGQQAGVTAKELPYEACLGQQRDEWNSTPAHQT